MVGKECIRKEEYSALLLEYWWLTYCRVRSRDRKSRGRADYLGLLNPETVTGFVVLHSERYGTRLKCRFRPDSSKGSLQRPSKLSSSASIAR